MAKYDRCYGKDFEDRLARKLENLGFKVYKSVYSEYNGIRSQIDLVVVNGFLICTIECKGFDAKRIQYKRSRKWSYLHKNGSVITVSNPIVQSEHHAHTLFMNMVNDIESDVYEKTGLCIPTVMYAVFLKGDIEGWSEEYVFTENRDSFSDLLRLLSYDNKEDDERTGYLSNKVCEWLDSHQDSSKESLSKHSKYIMDCKKNKTGLFSGESVL